jgi:hypothetical protein
MRLLSFSVVSICLLVFLTSCNDPNHQYTTLLNSELRSGKKVDSIFFDIKFGMPSKDFYLYCWNMNKKGVFTDGINNQYVLYKVPKGELKSSASMNFYPDFYKGKIVAMRVLYQYDAWAPWNKQLFADSLMLDVLHMYQRNYKNGNPFIHIHDDKRGDIYVKVDGNRRIIIGKNNEMVVKVDFTDLITEEELKHAQ